MGVGLVSAARRRSGGGGGPTDPFFANTVLLLSMDGADLSTTFTDESAAARGNASLAVGGASNNAQVSTSIKKFGTGSLLLDGSGDNLSFADHADWTLSGDFTIEGWCSFGNAESAAILVAHSNTNLNQRGWIFDYRGELATNILRFVAFTAGTSASSVTVISGAWTPTASTFYHLCLERSGTTFRIYVDGAMLAKATNAISIFDSSAALTIGTTSNLGAGDMGGNIDELRITLAARYNSDAGFAVPTAAFPRS